MATLMVHAFIPRISLILILLHNSPILLLSLIMVLEGHITATCHFRFTIPSHSEVEPCQICLKTNHTAMTCFYRNSVPSSSSHCTPTTTMAAQACSSSPSTEVWIADTGATNYMTVEFGNLSAPTPYIGSETISTANGYIGYETITTANGSGLAIAHIGSSSISTPTSSLQLTNVLHVP
ncbi:unnamed protein product [Prunus armeniaca]